MRNLHWLKSLFVLPFATLATANCLLVAATLVISTSVTAQSQEEIIKFDVSLVTVSVAVKDHKGRALVGLKPEDFIVTDENTRVSPEFFDSDGPASIVFVVDTSSSMKGSKWKSVVEGLKKFTKKARADNDYTLVAFQSRAHIVAESVNAADLWTSLKELGPGGETALYDAVMLGLKVLQRTPQRNKALVLISDGEDNSSCTRLAEIEKEAYARRATIYSVGVLLEDYCSRGIKEACSGKDTVKQLATITGGLAFFPDQFELPKVLKEISNEVTNQYNLSYYPPNKNSGWRNVHVAVALNDREPKLRYQQRYLMR